MSDLFQSFGKGEGVKSLLMLMLLVAVPVYAGSCDDCETCAEKFVECKAHCESIGMPNYFHTCSQSNGCVVAESCECRSWTLETETADGDDYSHE